MDFEYAKRVIRRVEHFFTHWEDHPLRTQEDVLRLLQASIVLAGGEAPPLPRGPRDVRRGGWRVGAQ